jgi:cytidylate kinase
MRKPIIAIDGPAGSGKSTLAKALAGSLGLLYIDTGAMYRAVTLAALRAGTPMEDHPLGSLAESSDIRMEPAFDGQRVYLNGEDVTTAIRRADVTGSVSAVSSFPSVRRALVQRQRSMGLNGGVVMDGRDIGSVVFPYAEVKVFLVADTDERVRRRLLEAQERGDDVDADAVRRQIVDRDKLDSERSESPLIQPEGATMIDTTSLTIDEQVRQILDLVHRYQTTYDLVSQFGNL